MVDGLPWNLSLHGLLGELDAAPAGLSNKAAKRRRTEYGPNDALIRRRRPLWRQTLDRLANPLILILLFASGLSAWTGEVTSFVIIVVIILLSVVLDVVQQARAENTVDALRRSVGLTAQALRDGEAHEIPVDQLVPGDVVELKAGGIVPGDCRLLTERDLFVNQAMLTGEARHYREKRYRNPIAVEAAYGCGSARSVCSRLQFVQTNISLCFPRVRSACSTSLSRNSPSHMQRNVGGGSTRGRM